MILFILCILILGVFKVIKNISNKNSVKNNDIIIEYNPAFLYGKMFKKQV